MQKIRIGGEIKHLCDVVGSNHPEDTINLVSQKGMRLVLKRHLNVYERTPLKKTSTTHLLRWTSTWAIFCTLGSHTTKNY